MEQRNPGQGPHRGKGEKPEGKPTPTRRPAKPGQPGGELFEESAHKSPEKPSPPPPHRNRSGGRVEEEGESGHGREEPFVREDD